MADAKIYKGGTPVFRPLWCDGDYAQYGPSFQMPNNLGTPPYDSHFDGAAGLGYFTGWMPIRPSIMKYQRDALIDAKLNVDDIIQCIVIPVDHYATFLNLKISEVDKALAGATVAVTAQKITRNEGGDYIIEEIQDIEKAAAAQGKDTPIALDTPSNTFLSLMVDDSGYIQPLYSEPDAVIIIGLKIVALPSDKTVTLDMARNGWYMSVKVEGFECATQM